MAMIELTEEQSHALNGAGLPLVLDPESQTRYVLVRADVYERMRAVIDGMTKRAGWDDQTLDEYERYRKPT